MPMPASARGAATEESTPVSSNAIGPATLRHRQPFSDRTSPGTPAAAQTMDSSRGVRVIA